MSVLSLAKEMRKEYLHPSFHLLLVYARQGRATAKVAEAHKYGPNRRHEVCIVCRG